MNEIINQDLLKLITDQGYLIMFGLAILEGPIIGFFGAIGALFGYFDIRIVFLISLAGDLIGDSIYYLAGRFSSKIGKKKLSRDNGFLHKIGTLIEKHPIKTMILVKFTPYMQPPGLIFLGYKKMNFKKFILWSLILSLPNSIIFVLGGYFFTDKIVSLLELLDIAWLPYMAIPIIIALLLIIYKKVIQKIID